MAVRMLDTSEWRLGDMEAWLTCMMRVCSLSSWSPTLEYSFFSCATCCSSSRPVQEEHICSHCGLPRNSCMTGNAISHESVYIQAGCQSCIWGYIRFVTAPLTCGAYLFSARLPPAWKLPKADCALIRPRSSGLCSQPALFYYLLPANQYTNHLVKHWAR